MSIFGITERAVPYSCGLSLPRRRSSGAVLDGRLGRRGISAALVLSVGLAILAAAAVTLLAITVAGWTPLTLIVTLLMTVALAFGMTMPNIMNATMQPLPEIAGAVGAAAGSIQMTAGAASSGLVAVLFDGRSPLSMTAVMAVCSLLALITYWLLAHRAERRLHSQTAEVPAATEGATRSWSSAFPQQKPTK